MAIYQDRWPRVARRWWGDGRVCQGNWIFETLLIKPIRVRYFINTVSKFPLTYRSELIDKDSANIQRRKRRVEFTLGAVLYQAPNPMTQPMSQPSHSLPQNNPELHFERSSARARDSMNENESSRPPMP